MFFLWFMKICCLTPNFDFKSLGTFKIRSHQSYAGHTNGHPWESVQRVWSSSVEVEHCVQASIALKKVTGRKNETCGINFPKQGCEVAKGSNWWYGVWNFKQYGCTITVKLNKTSSNTNHWEYTDHNILYNTLSLQ